MAEGDRFGLCCKMHASAIAVYALALPTNVFAHAAAARALRPSATLRRPRVPAVLLRQLAVHQLPPLTQTPNATFSHHHVFLTPELKGNGDGPRRGVRSSQPSYGRFPSPALPSPAAQRLSPAHDIHVRQSRQHVANTAWLRQWTGRTRLHSRVERQQHFRVRCCGVVAVGARAAAGAARLGGAT